MPWAPFSSIPPENDRSKARQELLKYLTTGNTAQKFEVCGALGTSGDRQDEGVLEALLRSEERRCSRRRG